LKKCVNIRGFLCIFQTETTTATAAAAAGVANYNFLLLKLISGGHGGRGHHFCYHGHDILPRELLFSLSFIIIIIIIISFIGRNEMN